MADHAWLTTQPPTDLPPTSAASSNCSATARTRGPGSWRRRGYVPTTNHLTDGCTCLSPVPTADTIRSARYLRPREEKGRRDDEGDCRVEEGGSLSGVGWSGWEVALACRWVIGSISGGKMGFVRLEMCACGVDSESRWEFVTFQCLNRYRNDIKCSMWPSLGVLSLGW